MQVIELPKVAEEPSAPCDKATVTVKVDGKLVTVACGEVVRVPVDQINQQTAAKVQPADSPSVAATETKPSQDRQHCDHALVNADAGAGTVVKSTGKMYWGHKASTLSFAEQEVLLDAVAMSDAASHDSQSLMPHLRRMLQRHPDLRWLVTRMLDDVAADDPQRKASIRE